MILERDGVVWELKEDDPNIESFKRAGYVEVPEEIKEEVEELEEVQQIEEKPKKGKKEGK